MNDESLDRWFTKHLFDSHSWYPERLGHKKSIFARDAGATILSMAIDPALDVPKWRKLDGMSYSESLFSLLRPFVEKDAIVVHLTNPDGAWIERHGCYRLSPELWTPWLLRFFDETSVIEGGAKLMIVLLRDKAGALVFKCSDVFEIAFYGSEDLWQEISGALNFVQ